MESIVYDIRWSNQLDEEFVKDFCLVCSTVFQNVYSVEYFNRKFIKNIYGPSVLTVVYVDDEPSAARALWRNDVNGKESYQPGDTCVMDNCRGKGIFSEMTNKSMALLPNDTIVYNFPNHSSYPGYIKMGWKLLYNYNLCLLTCYKTYAAEHPLIMDVEYAKWWVLGRNLTYTKRGTHWFLLQKDCRYFCYRILAEVDENIAKQFPYTKLGLFFYKSKKHTWYNKYFSPAHVVTRNPEIGYIPNWKIDAI